MSLHWLCNPADLRVIRAKEHRCELCAAPPDENCRPPIAPGRVVHLARTSSTGSQEIDST